MLAGRERWHGRAAGCCWSEVSPAHCWHCPPDTHPSSPPWLLAPGLGHCTWERRVGSSFSLPLLFPMLGDAAGAALLWGASGFLQHAFLSILLPVLPSKCVMGKRRGGRNEEGKRQAQGTGHLVLGSNVWGWTPEFSLVLWAILV